MPGTNLTVVSSVGHVNSKYPINAVPPFIETLQDLAGNTYPGSGVFPKIISVNSLTTFASQPFTITPRQQVVISNIGSADVNVTNIVFNDVDCISIKENGFPRNFPHPIPPGDSLKFDLSYYSELTGSFISSVTIESDNDQGLYVFSTRQDFEKEFTLVINPSEFIVPLDDIGATTSTIIVAELSEISILNGYNVDEFEVSFVSGGQGWNSTVLEQVQNRVSVRVDFDADRVGNVNGIYSGQLRFQAGVNNFEDVTIEAQLNIDLTKFYNLYQWLSPASGDNSIIGVSYDVINGNKTLTIGVGAGGNNSPVYNQGGNLYLSLNNLGIGANTKDIPYIYWAEVYRFRNLGRGTPQTLLSGSTNSDGDYLYQEKFTDNINYGYYFGSEKSVGSMFVVNDDGRGNLTITLNNIREFSGDENFDNTLLNLTRALHYYSEKDIGGRIRNLVQYPIGNNPTGVNPQPVGETRTNLFRGFVYENKTLRLTALSTASQGSTQLIINRTTGLNPGDTIKTIGSTTVEGFKLNVVSVDVNTGIIDLANPLPFEVTTGSVIIFKNPVSVQTSLVAIPR